MKKDKAYKETNREKSQKSSKRKYWCNHCDGALCGDFGKCPNCGKKQKNGKIK